ncbi:hypothetical protein [Rhodococcus sp. NPDC127528]|uniref:hypothetical protein n=1 Tax=unclassified Rhodococcus (in: high G+C Gram-positive bacteria) TaxID=192944 RepID=UPI00363CC604
MDLFDVARSCFRRWYVFLPMMMVVVWFSHNAYAGVKPVYYASATVGFAPPSVVQPDIGEVRRNALVDTGGASLLANLLAMGLKDPSVVQQVVAAGGLPDYNAKVMELPPPGGQLPLVMIEATNADPAAVTKTLELVAAQGDVTLQTLQRNARVPEDRMVGPFSVQPPGTPVPGMPSRTRSTVTIFVAGTGLAVLATVLLDLLLMRRKDRNAVPVPAPPADATHSGPGPGQDDVEVPKLPENAVGDPSSDGG